MSQAQEPVAIVDRATGNPVAAILHKELDEREIIDVEMAWSPERLQGLRELRKKGVLASNLPQHVHWNWALKAVQISSMLAFRSFGIEAAGKMQGLMIVLLTGKNARLAPDKNKPLVYVDFIETAPWNSKEFTNSPLYKGVGVRLIQAESQSTKCITPTPATPMATTDVVVEAFALFDPSHLTIGTGSGTDVPARRWSRCLVGMDADDAGHVIGNALGGSGKLADGNIFPQVLGINRGKYNQREAGIRTAISKSCSVCVNIKFTYPQSGQYIGRPSQQGGITYDVYVDYVKNPKMPVDFSNPTFNN